VAWDRVSGNKGAATARVDRRTASSIVVGHPLARGLPVRRQPDRDVLGAC
jgi:RNA-directed DNA polymerase